MKLAECHPTRKHQARGLCKSCYDKWLKSVRPEYKDAQQSNTSKWAAAHPERVAEYKRKRREKEAADPRLAAKKRSGWLKRKYGINEDQYQAMLSRQGGGCALCGRKPGIRRLHVDHCHTSGRVRGLLCHQCNWYMGTIDADPSILERIHDYRERKPSD